MKVWLEQASGIGGVQRVFEGLYKHLPAYGIEIVHEYDQADVIHAHIGLYKEVAIDKPLVVSSHGLLWTEHKWGGSAEKINRLCIEAYRQADEIIVPSDFIANAIARNMCLSTRVVRHGIDVEEWEPLSNEGYILWNKARVDAANDPADLNKLAELTPKISFVTTYGNKVSNVYVTGTMPSEEMKQLVQHANVYFDTSKESGGPCFGVLEAMSCGVPVLSWNFGGTAEAIIHKETGYLAEPGNFDDLVQGLQYCLKYRDQLGKAAREQVIQHYQWKDLVGGYVQAYQAALDKQNSYEQTVGIVVPCYNLGSFLPACIDSVLSQNYEDWQLVIVDDASTDNSVQIAQQQAERDPRISVIKNISNRHVSDTRNRGIEHLNTRYILPLDADDRLAPSALSNMVTALTDRSIDIVSGHLALFNEGDYENGRLGEWPNNAEYDLQIQGFNRLPYASMYRKTTWEKLGGYRRRIRDGVEDADFWTRALSFGSRATIIDPVTLLYTMRNNSLGKQNSRGKDAWLPWFGWSNVKENTPFGATTKLIQAYDRPEVSVVIPVGPDHFQHLQGCLDSLLAQTDSRWEAIVVNDTGQLWNTLPGMPFVTLVDSDQNKGVATARNAGIKAAKADKIIFLDVDDVAQPRMVELLLKAQILAGGWVYSDWYTLEDKQLVLHEAQDWDIQAFSIKMLGPVTGIYEKAHLELIGGFTVDAPGWEDWDMQYKLVDQGVCGTRLKYPAFVYNMHLGYRREENFSRAKDLVQYIQSRHKRSQTMACSKCGGKSSVRVNVPTVAGDDKVLMQYTGNETNFRHFKSPTKRGVTYRVSNQHPFEVYKSDVPHFTARKSFEVISQPPPVLSDQTEAIYSQAQPYRSIDSLPIKPEIKTVIRDQFPTIEELIAAADSELLALKGIGPARLEEIRAVAHV